MRTAVSRNGVTIRLNDERWQHIVEGHPEMGAFLEEILAAIRDPDAIYEGESGELIAQRSSDGLYLIVAYRETTATDGFVITAHLVRRPPRKRVMWKRQASTST